MLLIVKCVAPRLTPLRLYSRAEPSLPRLEQPVESYKYAQLGQEPIKHTDNGALSGFITQVASNSV